MMTLYPILRELRENTGTPLTAGLADRWLNEFADDASLRRALQLAESAWAGLSAAERELVKMPEAEVCELLHDGYANFYPAPTIDPYVALAAAGPWIVSAYGAVIYSAGGYGMLGFGFNPVEIEPFLGSPQVMANVMTPSFAHHRFMDALRRECAHGRGSNPFPRFACLNSGSEAMTLAMRLSDMNAFNLTEPGGRYEGRTPWVVAMEHGFHGRTERPAQISDSCREAYTKHLASHRDRRWVKIIAVNDVAALHAAFDEAEQHDAFIEAVVFEPVQGEGNPGLAISRPFYDAARYVTRDTGAFLIVDAVQAGLRAYGCLSTVSAHGFTDAEAPDVEVWSKALNAGQYPLSVVGMGPRAAEIFRPGVYGNTMTSNPRALDIGTAVLQAVTESVRENIRVRGAELVNKLFLLREEVGDVVGEAQGTGLLVSIKVRDDVPVVAHDGLEQRCRKRGLSVIHGGDNALRFTPGFRMSSAEVDLVVDIVRESIMTFQ